MKKTDEFERAADEQTLPSAKAIPVATPQQWAGQHGDTRARKRRGFGGADPGVPGFSAIFLGAAQEHGWFEHSEHTTEPLLITETDYLSAMEAAGRGTKHQPAESPLVRVAREQRRVIVEARLAQNPRNRRRHPHEVKR